jgi:hypothetical protein
MTSVAIAFAIIALLLAWSAHAELRSGKKPDLSFIGTSYALSTVFFLMALAALSGAV